MLYKKYFPVLDNLPEELPDIRPLEAVRQFQGHLLAIHGTEDQVVRPYNSERYIEAVRATARGVGRVDIEGAGHSFSGLDNSEELIGQTVAWFETHQLSQSLNG